jgi:hypothetical protein
MSDAHPKGSVQIYIRCKPHMLEKLQTRTFNMEFANHFKHLVHYYVG